MTNLMHQLQAWAGEGKNEDRFTHWQPLPNSELVARLKGGER
jgi:hypothetical protein